MPTLHLTQQLTRVALLCAGGFATWSYAGLKAATQHGASAFALLAAATLAASAIGPLTYPHAARMGRWAAPAGMTLAGITLTWTTGLPAAAATFMLVVCLWWIYLPLKAQLYRNTHQKKWGWIPVAFDLGTVAGTSAAGLLLTLTAPAATPAICITVAALAGGLPPQPPDQNTAVSYSGMWRGMKLMLPPATIIAGVAAVAEVAPGIAVDTGPPWWATIAAVAVAAGMLISPLLVTWADQHPAAATTLAAAATCSWLLATNVWMVFGASLACALAAQVAYLVGDLRAGRTADDAGVVYAGSSLGWYVAATPATSAVATFGMSPHLLLTIAALTLAAAATTAAANILTRTP